MMLRFLLMGLLMVALLPGLPSTARGQLSIQTEVDRDRITIGDRITYTVTITRDPDLEIVTPGLAANLGQFEIKDYQVHDPRSENGKLVDVLEYSITTFDTGQYVIPPLPIGYMVSDSTVFAMAAEPLYIYVESVATGDAKDIRDIKGPVFIPLDRMRILLWGLVGLAVLSAAFGGWYYWKKRRAGESLLPSRRDPMRPAHDVALEAIASLQASPLLAEGRVKEYHVTLSDIVRQYLEGRYFVTAVEMTTTDILRSMDREDVPEEARGALRRTLEDCDFVKFAKFRPDTEASFAMTDRAVDFVEQTQVAIFGEIGELMASAEYAEKM